MHFAKEDVVFSNVSINEIKIGEFFLLYAHPETFLINKDIGKILCSPKYQTQVLHSHRWSTHGLRMVCKVLYLLGSLVILFSSFVILICFQYLYIYRYWKGKDFFKAFSEVGQWTSIFPNVHIWHSLPLPLHQIWNC